MNEVTEVIASKFREEQKLMVCAMHVIRVANTILNIDTYTSQVLGEVERSAIYDKYIRRHINEPHVQLLEDIEAEEKRLHDWMDSLLERIGLPDRKTGELWDLLTQENQ